MKMLLFVLSIFMFFLVFNSTLIGAKNVENNDDILLYEVISYHETIYENGELKEQKTLNKAEYEKKVKIEKEKKLKFEDNDLIFATFGCEVENCFEDGGGVGGGPTFYSISFNSNGGSYVPSITQLPGTAVTKPQDPTYSKYKFEGWYSDINLTQRYTFTTMPYQNITLYAKWDLSSVIEYDNVSLAKTYCYEDTITYCESNNLKVTTYSALNTMKAKVYLNPNNYKDGFVKLEYNWDVIPHDRWDDYMSISHNPNIYLLDDTIKGTLNYEYIKKEYMCDSTRRCWITSSNLIKPNPTNYDLTNNQDNFKFDQSYGVIFSASLPGDVTYTYNFEEVTKINFTLESRFRIQSDGTQSFRDLGIIKFGFDYRHSFLKINLFNIGSNANVTLSGADLGMSINPTLLIDVDESRYSSITLEFN